MVTKRSNRASTLGGGETILLIGNCQIETVARGPFSEYDIKMGKLTKLKQGISADRSDIWKKEYIRESDVRPELKHSLSSRKLKRSRSDMGRFIFRQKSDVKLEQKISPYESQTQRHSKQSTIMKYKESSVLETEDPPSYTSITPRSPDKVTLKTRITALEQLAFDDGWQRDGLLVSRIKELENFIFDTTYIPPNNLSSRVDILARQFE